MGQININLDPLSNVPREIDRWRLRTKEVAETVAGKFPKEANPLQEIIEKVKATFNK